LRSGGITLLVRHLMSIVYFREKVGQTVRRDKPACNKE
jgi:hypothetical protein